MTQQELTLSLNMLLTNYRQPFDANLQRLWEGLFLAFDARTFSKACLIIASENKFFPNASEIISAYRRVRKDDADALRTRQMAHQKQLADSQAYCHLCDNSGWCKYHRGSYEYAARCICAHGKDLNLFSAAEIDRRYRADTKTEYTDRENNAIKAGKNPFYLPDIREALDKLGEDFASYDAERKLKHVQSKPRTPEERAEILKRLNEMVGRSTAGDVLPERTVSPWDGEEPDTGNDDRYADDDDAWYVDGHPDRWEEEALV